RLPGARTLAVLLGVSRKTVNLAYEELEAQGWIEVMPQRGTFVSLELPIIAPKELAATMDGKNLGSFQPERDKTAFKLHTHLDFLHHYSPPTLLSLRYTFDTGYPDVRLAPNRELSQALHRTLTGKRQQRIMNYAKDFRGHPSLLEEVLKYLSETRGIQAKRENLFITRGSLMAFSAIFRVLLQPGDQVVTGDLSFQVANNIIRIAGGKVLTIPVDEEGIDVDALALLCKREKIRAVFVMPHHHHPTTVALSAARRMKLLHLAAEHGFAIIEDDYDYDFHYSASPILPMASADQWGTVLYVGSFSKTVAPGLRTGFVLGPKSFIDELARISRFMDCHGNPAIEKALANLFREGVIRRHLKKSLKIY
ncbi:MAG: PLP-dependent aminotransferase family protein, partial [Bacteroidota bacterium]